MRYISSTVFVVGLLIFCQNQAHAQYMGLSGTCTIDANFTITLWTPQNGSDEVFSDASSSWITPFGYPTTGVLTSSLKTKIKFYDQSGTILDILQATPAGINVDTTVMGLGTADISLIKGYANMTNIALNSASNYPGVWNAQKMWKLYLWSRSFDGFCYKEKEVISDYKDIPEVRAI